MHSLSLTTERRQILDFSPPIEFSGMGLLMRRHGQVLHLNWEAYFLPFTLETWMAAWFLHLIFSVGLWLLKLGDHKEQWPRTLPAALWTLYGALTQQGMT